MKLYVFLFDNKRLVHRTCRTTREPVFQYSRTLKNFERYGFVEMIAGKRSKKPVTKSVDFDICIVRSKTGVEQSGLL